MVLKALKPSKGGKGQKGNAKKNGLKKGKTMLFLVLVAPFVWCRSSCIRDLQSCPLIKEGGRGGRM